MAAAEQKKSYQVVRAFRGVNTKANRTAIEENEFSWLENAMPVGSGNLKVTPSSTSLGPYTQLYVAGIVNTFNVSINLTDYLIAFDVDGGATYTVLASSAVPPLSVNTTGTLAAIGTFTPQSFTTVATATLVTFTTVRFGSRPPYQVFGSMEVLPTTVTGQVITGTFAIGQLISASGINPSLYITSYGTGTGGAGTYGLSGPPYNTVGTGSPIAATAKVRPQLTTNTGGFKVSNWNNQYVLILDPFNGYFTWDGTNLVKIGSIGGIGISNPGTNYKSAPTITIGAPNQTGGVQATALCSITNTAGQVNVIQVTTPGSGYTSIPTVTISAPPAPGIRAVAAASISGNVGNLSVVSIGVVNPGSGYTSAPSVSITGGGGAGANATASIDTGSISQIFLTNAGSGYTSPPSITFSGGGGSNAAAVSELLTFAQGTMAVQVTSGGSGYTNASNTVVTISGGGGTNAAGTAIISGGEVVSVIMSNPGKDYSNSANITVTISGGGATVNALANAVVTTNQGAGIDAFSGRVWIAQGRTVYFSAAGSISDFVSVSAGEIVLADSTLHGNITQIISANNFLYLFGDDSINVFSDVQVTTAGTTVFTNTNISASIGTKRAYAIFPYFRTLLFMNDYGVYALVGSTTTKISDALDGIFPLINFTRPITGGQVLLNNILCAVFNFYYTGTQGTVSTGRHIQAVFFDKKWFFTSDAQDFDFISSAPVGGKISMYGYQNAVLSGDVYYATNVYQMYSNQIASVSSYVQTALMSMSDPIRTKQALKFGIEASNLWYGYFMTATVDSEYGSSDPYQLGASDPYTWINDAGSLVAWTNSSNAIVYWIGDAVGLVSPFYLYKSDAKQYGKYLGLTITSTAPPAIYNTFEFEYELRVRF